MASTSDDVSEKVAASTSIDNDSVMTKYTVACDIANNVLEQVCAKAVEGALVTELCGLGDRLIVEQTAAMFNKKKKEEGDKKTHTMKKGIAFPTCVSVNNIVCHNSPVDSDPAQTLKTGDVVKIDLGAHIDGYIGEVATTLVVGATAEAPTTGRAADAMAAAYHASELATRLFAKGNKTYDVTDGIQKIAEAFDCKPIEGMQSHQLERNNVAGAKMVILNPNDQQRKETKSAVFEANEVYCVDILVSTGNGKAKIGSSKCNVYRRTEKTYQLKVQAARKLFADVTANHGPMPFSLRSFSEVARTRFAITELLQNDLLEQMHVYEEPESEVVAQYKFVVMITANGPKRASDPKANPALFVSEKKIEDQAILDILNKSISKKANKKRKKAAAAAAATTEEEAPKAE